MIRHLLISYHTCPMEEPGVGLSGGMNTFLRGLLSGLGGHGVDTVVLTRGKEPAPRETRPFPGARILHVPCGWTEPPTRESAFRALPRFSAAAARLLAKEEFRFDVVSAHYWMSGVAGGTMRSVAGLPVVLSYHTVEARKRAAAGASPSALSGRRSRAEEDLSRSASRVVFFTEDDLRATAALLPDVEPKSLVIPPGVDDAFRHPPPRSAARRELGIPDGTRLFLVAARPDAGKNTEEAVEAFGALHAEEASSVRLLVAGGGAPGGAAAPSGVAFLGPVPHSEMPRLYAAADAVLCTSPYESFGLVQLEALACGVPVVVPVEGFWGRKIRAGGGGLTFSGGVGGGLLGAMRRILAGEGLRERLSREAREVASPFTWASCRESWARLLSTAATRGNPR